MCQISCVRAGQKYVLQVPREGTRRFDECNVSQGLPVDDIAAENGMDPMKLGDRSLSFSPDISLTEHIARVLRFLAARHIFKEISPGVFSNNRMSGALCVNKAPKDIKAK